jgi:hypothetical protein
LHFLGSNLPANTFSLDGVVYPRYIQKEQKASWKCQSCGEEMTGLKIACPLSFTISLDERIKEYMDAERSLLKIDRWKIDCERTISVISWIIKIPILYFKGESSTSNTLFVVPFYGSPIANNVGQN